MKRAEKDKLEKSLNSYFKDIHKIYIAGNFREESFYSSLKTLIEQCSQLFSFKTEVDVLIQPEKTEIGVPDFLIRKDGEKIGYIEAKTPNTDLDKVEDLEQIKRYLDFEPNLILTNFLEFRLYRNGDLLDS